MSADNWTICPKCNVNLTKTSERAKLEAGEAYGKVSPEEYLNMLKQANLEPNIEPTLREDYGLHLDEDGEFTISYTCSCRICGFDFEYKHTEKVPL